MDTTIQRLRVNLSVHGISAVLLKVNLLLAIGLAKIYGQAKGDQPSPLPKVGKENISIFTPWLKKQT